MSRKKSVVKLPDNVKQSSVQRFNVRATDVETESLAKIYSWMWIGTGISALGFATIPVTTWVFGLPVLSSTLTITLFVITVAISFAEGVSKDARKYFKKLVDIKRADPKKPVSDYYTCLGSWTKPGFKTAHLYLPFRMFRKIKLHESVMYFPSADVYVKQTHYLTFNRWLRIEERFEGQRAVFKKALDTFGE